MDSDGPRPEQKGPLDAATGQKTYPETAPSLAGRLLRLCLALACLWVVVYVLAPLPVEHFEPMRTFARAARENDITPGSLYYTDVPVSTQAEMSNRDTIRYFYGKKERQGE